MRRVLFILASVLSIAACGGGSKSVSEESTTTSSAEVTTTQAPTTLPPRSTTTVPKTTTTDPLKSGGETPEQAADGFQNAWKASSREGAKPWGDQAAIDVMFRTAYTDTDTLEYKFQSCAANPGFNNAMTCSYTYHGGSLHFIMSNAVGKWRVSRVQFIAD